VVQRLRIVDQGDVTVDAIVSLNGARLKKASRWREQYGSIAHPECLSRLASRAGIKASSKTAFQ
jgi:hypothetical protein